MNHTELIAVQLRKMAGRITEWILAWMLRNNFPPWHCCQLKQASVRAVSCFLTLPSTEGPTLHIFLSAAGRWWRCFCRGKQRSFTSAKTRKGFPTHTSKCTGSVEKNIFPLLGIENINKSHEYVICRIIMEDIPLSLKYASASLKDWHRKPQPSLGVGSDLSNTSLWLAEAQGEPRHPGSWLHTSSKSLVEVALGRT